MRLFSKGVVVLFMLLLGVVVFGQECLGMNKKELEKTFVEGRGLVVEVKKTSEGFQVVQNKRDQRNMKHRICYSFTFAKERVVTYSIKYPSNSFMEEEISMFLSMNEDKEPLSEQKLKINGNIYHSVYRWDMDIHLEIKKENDVMELTFWNQ